MSERESPLNGVIEIRPKILNAVGHTLHREGRSPVKSVKLRVSASGLDFTIDIADPGALIAGLREAGDWRDRS